MDFPHDIRENITSDKNRIRQILINLLGNSLKFTINGQIKVSVLYL